MTDFNVETLNYYYKQNVLKKCTKSRDHRMYLSVTEWVFKGFQNYKYVHYLFIKPLNIIFTKILILAM